MPSYSAPSDFGTIEPIPYAWEDSPLSQRPVYPVEMAAVIQEYLTDIFSQASYLINRNLEYLTEDDSITILTTQIQDDSNVYPKITISPLPYQTKYMPSSQDAGVRTEIGPVQLSGTASQILIGACQLVLSGNNRYEMHQLLTEIQLLFLRDRKMFMRELNLASLTPERAQIQGKDQVGASVSSGPNFRQSVIIRWSTVWAPMLWTENTF